MIRSYKIFLCGGQIKRCALFELIAAAVISAAGIAGRSVSAEWLNNVINGAAIIFGTVFFPIGFFVLLMGIYNINIPEQPGGYKYFHSLENSARHFQNAILLHNAVSAAALMCFYAVMSCLFEPYTMLTTSGYVFLALGMMNFLGHTRSIWGTLVPYCIMGMSVGFFASVRGEGVFGSEMFMIVLCSIAAAVYIAGTVFAVARARAVWEKESDK